MFALIGGDVRHGGGAGAADLPFPVMRPTPARRAAARRLGPLPRRRRRPVRPRRAAGRVRRRAARRRAVRAVGDDLGAPAHGRARALLPAAAPPLPARRRDRHLRPARQRLRARQGRPRPGGRGAAERRRRVLVGACAPDPARARSRPCLRAVWRGKRESRCSFGPGVHRLVSTSSRAGSGRRRSDPSPGRRHRRGRARRAGRRRRRCATSTPAPTSSCYRRIPTRDFREPWGLVVNEAFNQGVPVIATDAVGAVAGGLIEHERTGLVVPAGRRRRARGRPPAPARRPRAARAPRRCGARRRGRLHPRRLGRRDGARAGRRRRRTLGRAAASVPRLMTRLGHHRPAGAPAAAPAAQADSTRTKILRECQDGRLTGDYTAKRDPRRAQQHPGRHRPVLGLPRRAHAARC